MGGFFNDVLEDPRIKKAAGMSSPPPTPGQPAAPAPAPTPATASQGGFFDDVLQDDRVVKAATSATQTDDQPGFWKGALSQVNPIPAAKALWESAEAERQAVSKMTPAERRMYHLKSTFTKPFETAKGVVTGTVDTIKDVATDVGAGRYRTAAGKVTGIAAPLLVGGGVKAMVKPKARVPQGVAAMTAAEAELRRIRGGMPATLPRAEKGRAAQASRQRLAGTYERREGLRQSASQAASGKYSTYDKAIGHKRNIAAAGDLELRPAEFKMDADGNMVMVKDAVRNAVDYKAPVPSAPFRDVLDRIIEIDSRSPFPAGHPLRKFLDSLGVEKPGVLTSDPSTPALAKGYAYYEFDALKKALGRLSVYASPKSGLRDSYQGLASKVLEKAHPVLEEQLKEIARKSKVPIRDVLKSMEEGDIEWAKYHKAFGKLPTELAKGKAAYEAQAAALPGKAPDISPVPGITSVSQAVGELEGLQGTARSALNVEKATQKATEDWIRHSTSNPTNLDALTQIAGPQVVPELLGMTLDRIITTRDWGRWSKMNPDVVKRLIAHQPDLADSLPSIFSQLAELEKLQGPQVTQGVVSRAVQSVQKIHKSRLLRNIPGIQAVTGPADFLSLFLRDQTSARRLNQALRTQVARIPWTTRAARGAATATQAAPSARLAAEIAPPPERERMAGE